MAGLTYKLKEIRESQPSFFRDAIDESSGFAKQHSKYLTKELLEALFNLQAKIFPSVL